MIVISVYVCKFITGISDEVLEQLMVYDVNHTLWFATITHLTPYDCNFPYGPPPGGCSPSECDDLPGMCRDTLKQCCSEAWPPSQTVVQLQNNIVLTCRIYV